MSVSDFAPGDRVEVTVGVRRGTTGTVMRSGHIALSVVLDGETEPFSYAPVHLRRLPAATAPSPSLVPPAAPSVAHLIPVGIPVTIDLPHDDEYHGRHGIVEKHDPHCPDALVYSIDFGPVEWDPDRETRETMWFKAEAVHERTGLPRRLVITVDIPLGEDDPTDDVAADPIALIDWLAEHHETIAVSSRPRPPEEEPHAR